MIWHILSMILLLLLVFALLSPLESLLWWSRQVEAGQSPDPDEAFRNALALAAADPDRVDVPDAHDAPGVPHFVFMSGIAAIDQNEPVPEEVAVLQAVADRAGGRMCQDVFPYAASSNGLLQRGRARVWRWLDEWRLRRPSAVLPAIINIRNLFQVAVAADPRYGPTFSLGVAEATLRSLKAAGCRADGRDPVILIGYSGGAQACTGVARYLENLGLRVWVISIGGVFGDNKGLAGVQHLWEYHGGGDWVVTLGNSIFPAKWPTAINSTYRKAVKAGVITRIMIPSMTHMGARSYFNVSPLTDGRIAAKVTEDELVSLIRSTVEDASTAP